MMNYLRGSFGTKIHTRTAPLVGRIVFFVQCCVILNTFVAGVSGEMLALMLAGETLAMTEEKVKDSEDSVAKILWNIWNKNNTALSS